MKECECIDAGETMYQGAYYCDKCYCQIDPIIFEDCLTRDDRNPKSRYNKFHALLFGTEGLPWFVRHTLLDSFGKIENYFFDSDRINFINMNQLAIELCRKCGYEEYCCLFKSLKTKSRVKQVAHFIETAMPTIVVDKIPQNMFRLEDMEFLTPVAEHVDMSKVYDDKHIYSDIDEIRKKAVKVSNVPKAKAKNRKDAKVEG
jgi:hypothetical protein